MKYACDHCGYLGDTGPEHSAPGKKGQCPSMAEPIEDVPVEVHQDDEDNKMLDAMLSKAQADHKARLARISPEATESTRENQRRYLEALHSVRVALISFQFAEDITFPEDRTLYASILFGLSEELMLAALGHSTDTPMQNKDELFRAVERICKEGIRRGQLPAGHEPSQILNAHGQPVHRKPRRH